MLRIWSENIEAESSSDLKLQIETTDGFEWGCHDILAVFHFLEPILLERIDMKNILSARNEISSKTAAAYFQLLSMFSSWIIQNLKVISKTEF